ncbi:colanic acid exporter [Rathayibacter sp. AY1B1]|nr:colanic acid exporter [Rathayibacter sp. AY1B6]PPI39721.1 colanic acid exporter [Rathayibacter sp. AY1B1]
MRSTCRGSPALSGSRSCRRTSSRAATTGSSGRPTPTPTWPRSGTIPVPDAEQGHRGDRPRRDARSRPGAQTHESRAVAGAKWTAFSVVGGSLGQILQIFVLARILGQEEFGLVAMITILNSLLDVFIGLGLTNALIVRRSVTSSELSSVHWLNVGFSALVVLIVAGASPAVAAFFHAPGAWPLLVIGSSAFLITSWGQAARAMLEKRLLFKPLGIADVLFAALLLSVSLVLALAGAGAASAAWAVVVASAGRTAVFLVAGRRYFRLRRRFRWSDTRRFLSFGVLQSLDGVLNYIGNTLSSISTGRFVSTAALGGYNLAFNVGVSIPGRINPIITRVLFPYFALIQDDLGRIRQNYLRMVTLCGLASIPLLVGVALTAEDVMVLVFGRTWAGYGEVLALLAVVGMLRALGNPLGSLLQATDNVRLGLAFNLVRTTVNIPLVIVSTMTGGVLGAAWSMVAMGAMSYVIGFLCLRRITRATLREYLASTLSPFLHSVPLALAVVAVGLLLQSSPTVLRFAAQVVAAVLALLITLVLSRDATVVLLVGTARARSSRAPARTVAVLLPVEERFDGTGGAVASWVRNAYRPLSSTLSVEVFCPAASPDFASGVPLAPLRSYSALDRLLRGASRAAGALTRRNPHGVLRLLTLQGVVWVWWCSPSLARADVVHIHNRPGYAVQLRRSGYAGRIVLHMHNDAVDSVESWVRRGFGARRGVDEVLRSVDDWAFCSGYLRRRAVDLLGVPGDRSSVLYNGATVVAGSRSDRGRPEVVSALFAGRLIAEKGVVEAVRVCGAANRIAPTTLDVYGGKATGSSTGESPYIRRVREEARRVNEECGVERVRVHGFVTPHVLLEEMARADVLLYPCRWEEPFGMVLVDAMSVGTPVVAPARGGIPEIIDDGVDGRLLPPDADDQEFAEAIVGLALSDRYPAMARRAVEKASTLFSWDSIAEELQRVLRADGPVLTGDRR